MSIVIQVLSGMDSSVDFTIGGLRTGIRVCMYLMHLCMYACMYLCITYVQYILVLVHSMYTCTHVM